MDAVDADGVKPCASDGLLVLGMLGQSNWFILKACRSTGRVLSISDLELNMLNAAEDAWCTSCLKESRRALARTRAAPELGISLKI